MSISIRSHLEQMSDTEMSEMLRHEYLRRLLRYQKTDESMRKKYGMSFDDFETGNMVATKSYSWDVESDAIAWETAIDGMTTMRQKLDELNGDA